MLITVICLISYVELIFANSCVNWDEVYNKWNTYLNYPSSEDALDVYEVLPTKHVEYNHSSEEKRTLNYIFNELDMLEKQVYSGDRNAVKLAFKLHVIADGAFSQWLDIILGNLIRIYPELFLEELVKYEEIIRLDSLVGNFGPIYVDKMKAHELESRLRIESLKTVKREECS